MKKLLLILFPFLMVHKEKDITVIWCGTHDFKDTQIGDSHSPRIADSYMPCTKTF